MTAQRGDFDAPDRPAPAADTTDDGLFDHCGCCSHSRRSGCGGPECPCSPAPPPAAAPPQDDDVLRRAIADAVPDWCGLVPEEHVRLADALLAGPLAPLLARERAAVARAQEAEAKIARVEALAKVLIDAPGQAPLSAGFIFAALAGGDLDKLAEFDRALAGPLAGHNEEDDRG